MAKRRLGVGFIGTGFNTRFHMQAWQGVRDADVLGVWSPNRKNAADAAALARRARRRRGQGLQVASPTWWPTRPSTRSGSAAPTTPASRTSRRSSTPSSAARETLIGHRLREAAGAHRGRGEAGARRSAEEAGLKHGYLENQLFAPQVERGRDPALGARRRHHRPALPGARGRGAQRPAHALVLAGQAAGRRRAQRHDVPLGAGGAPPAHQAGRSRAHRCGRCASPATSRSLKWSRPEYARRSRRRWASRWTTPGTPPRTSPA